MGCQRRRLGCKGSVCASAVVAETVFPDGLQWHQLAYTTLYRKRGLTALSVSSRC